MMHDTTAVAAHAADASHATTTGEGVSCMGAVAAESHTGEGQHALASAEHGEAAAHGRTDVHEVGEAAKSAGPGIGALAVAGAQHAAIVGGTLSAIRNIHAAARGHKTPRDAAVDTAVDTAGSAASGAVVGALGGVAARAMRGAGLGVLSRTAMPVAIGLTAVDIGRDAWARSKGRMDPARFKERVVVHVFRGGTTWIGLEIGAIAGTFVAPGVGTTVGAVLGGLLGGWVGTRLAEEDPKQTATEAPPAQAK